MDIPIKILPAPAELVDSFYTGRVVTSFYLMR